MSLSIESLDASTEGVAMASTTESTIELAPVVEAPREHQPMPDRPQEHKPIPNIPQEHQRTHEAPKNIPQESKPALSIPRMLVGVSTKIPTLMAEANDVRKVQQRIGREMDTWDAEMFMTRALPTHRELTRCHDRLEACAISARICHRLLDTEGKRTGLDTYAILRWRNEIRDLSESVHRTSLLVLQYIERINLIMRIGQSEQLEDLLVAAPDQDDGWRSSEYLPSLDTEEQLAERVMEHIVS
jgi:hypothetical protein